MAQTSFSSLNFVPVPASFIPYEVTLVRACFVMLLFLFHSILVICGHGDDRLVALRRQITSSEAEMRGVCCLLHKIHSNQSTGHICPNQSNQISISQSINRSTNNQPRNEPTNYESIFTYSIIKYYGSNTNTIVCEARQFESQIISVDALVIIQQPSFEIHEAGQRFMGRNGPPLLP